MPWPNATAQLYSQAVSSSVYPDGEMQPAVSFARVFLYGRRGSRHAVAFAKVKSDYSMIATNMMTNSNMSKLVVERNWFNNLNKKSRR